jgi:uncharacterized protein
MSGAGSRGGGLRSPDGIDARLRAALRDAMKARDPVAVAAVRAALALIDNASAVDVDGESLRPASAGTSTPAARSSIVGSVPGIGAGEAPRRELDAVARISLVEAEVAAWREAALEYEGIGRNEEAGRLRAEADVLAEILGSALRDRDD